MPKLIRLISGGEETADFSNFFQEDIRLKKNSRVALQSISIQLEDKNIIVDSNNNTFDIQVVGSKPRRTVRLTTGNYNSDTFIDELNRALNAALVWDDRNGNYDEWQAIWSKGITTTANLLSIQWNTVANDTDADIKSATSGITAATNTITKSGADGNWDYMYAQTAFSRGVGFFMGTISNANAVMNGVCIGFLSSIPESTITELPPSSYWLAVYTDANRYRVIVNGNDMPTTYIPQADDIISFTLSEGVITIAIRNRPNPIILASKNYPYPVLLHGAVSLKSTGNLVTDPSYTPCPYMVSSVAGEHLISNNDDFTTANYITNVGATPSGRASVHSIYMSDSVKRLMGYGKSTYSYTLQTGNFLASNPMVDDAVPSSLIVECPTLHMNSYDGAGHRRRNILSIIPAMEIQGINQVYMPTYPIYIDLHNSDEQLFNNIQIRVLDNNNDPVAINPDSGCAIALLIDG